MNGERILTFRDPLDGGCARESTLADLGSVPIGALDGVRVDLSGLLG